MRKARLRLVSFGLLATLASGGIAVAVQAPSGDPEVVELLSGMNYSPNKNSIDLVMGAEAVGDLIDIAEDSSAESDPGLRIRAYRALGQYELSPDAAQAEAALRLAVEQFSQANKGTDLLYLRASMLSLARVGRSGSVQELVALLDHPGRDIRAACAQALGITGSFSAIQPLRSRALIEEEPQVQLAIADALFELDSP